MYMKVRKAIHYFRTENEAQCADCDVWSIVLHDTGFCPACGGSAYEVNDWYAENHQAYVDGLESEIDGLESE